MDDLNSAVLSQGDEILAAITVRGSELTDAQALSMAKPALDEWQGQQVSRLSDGCHFQSSDAVSPPVDGHYTVGRTLKVVHDENA